MSASVRQAVQEALARGETHYTDRPGILPLRQEIADRLSGRFAVAVSAASDVIVTCGVTEARFVALQQMLRPGDAIWAPSRAERIAGAVLLRRAQLNPETDVPARVVYLTSHTPESRLRAVMDGLDPESLILFEVDDHGSLFHPAHRPGWAERTVTIGALGHPLWRIGYLVAPASASPGMREFKQALTICSTSLCQWAVLAALRESQP